jgi:hypothetical protein
VMSDMRGPERVGASLRCAAHPRRGPPVLCPRRELPRCPRRLVRHAADCVDRGQARRRGGEHGGSRRQTDRASGNLLRHARTGCHARQCRRPHGVSRFDADDPICRTGAT